MKLLPPDDPGVNERVRRERLAQGLPPTLEEPEAIRRLAVLFVAALDRLTGQVESGKRSGAA